MSIGAVAALSAIIAPPAWSQSGRTNATSAAAVLHLRVQVVPVAILLPPTVETNHERGSISFDLRPKNVSIDRMEESRPFPDGEGNDGRPIDPAVLKTMTVVAR